MVMKYAHKKFQTFYSCRKRDILVKKILGKQKDPIYHNYDYKRTQALIVIPVISMDNIFHSVFCYIVHQYSALCMKNRERFTATIPKWLLTTVVYP